MPIPKPRENESEADFISRCMGDDLMNEEYPDSDQRIAICYSQWRDRNKQHPHGEHVCVCPECGVEITVDENVKCNTQKCPKCGTRMRAVETGERRQIVANGIERKSIQIELKDDQEGTFIARIAKLDVVDLDGDVTKPGAFPKNKTVLVSAYQHGSWMGGLPVGKAVIYEKDGDVLAEGEFNLNTEVGREHYQTVKFTGKIQEWSYGFKIIKAGEDEVDGQPVRLLIKVDPFEISPVIKGAGISTATLAIKEKNGADDSLTYADQAETVLAAVDDLVDRTKLLADLRRKDGRELSEANREKIQSLADRLIKVTTGVKELLASTEPVDKAAAEKLFAEFTIIQTQILEVS